MVNSPSPHGESTNATWTRVVVCLIALFIFCMHCVFQSVAVSSDLRFLICGCGFCFAFWFGSCVFLLHACYTVKRYVAPGLELCVSNRPGVFLIMCRCVFQYVPVSSDLWRFLLFRLLISDWFLCASSDLSLCFLLLWPTNQSPPLDLSSVFLVLKTNQPSVILVMSQALRHTTSLGCLAVEASCGEVRRLESRLTLLSDEFTAAVRWGKAVINRSSKAASMNSWTGFCTGSGLSNASHPSPWHSCGVSSWVLRYEVEYLRWINNAALRSI